MWTWLRRGLRWMVGAPGEPPRVRVGRPEEASTGRPRLHVSFDRPPTGPNGDAWLCEVTRPAQFDDVLRFAGRRGLEVGGWVIWGFDTIPRPVDRRARWLASVADRARPAPVWLVPTGSGRPVVPTRLLANLRRLGCVVDRSRISTRRDSKRPTKL